MDGKRGEFREAGPAKTWLTRIVKEEPATYTKGGVSAFQAFQANPANDSLPYRFEGIRTDLTMGRE